MDARAPRARGARPRGGRWRGAGPGRDARDGDRGRGCDGPGERLPRRARPRRDRGLARPAQPRPRRPGPPLGRRSICRGRSTTTTSSRSTGPTPSTCPSSSSAPSTSAASAAASSSPTAAVSAREVEEQIDYCILCHERDKDSCSKGLQRPEDRRASRRTRSASPLAGVPARGEDQRDARDAAGTATSSPRSPSSCVDNPMCPGTGHRICNDCMKACVFQKQEPVNIPQIETRVLTETLGTALGHRNLRAAHALEPAQRPAPAHAALQRARTCSSSASGPAGYTLAHHLRVRGVRRRRRSTASRSSRSPRDARRHGTASARAGASDCRRLYVGARRAHPPRLRRRERVRHHGALGQELPHGHLRSRSARNQLLKMYGGVRFGGTMTLEDAWELGFDHVAIAAGAGGRRSST